MPDLDTREEYIVASLDQDGFITLATRRVFSQPEQAVDYARSMHTALRPYVIKGQWRALRFEGSE